MKEKTTRRVRNDPALYDELADAWWDPSGPFAMLQWIAAARGALVPPAARRGAVLVDLACGGGLLAPHVAGKGYRHLGCDLSMLSLRQAEAHGLTAVRADVRQLPFPDRCADVVCAGEILEHVAELETLVAETTRILRPGGVVVVDTIAATALARLLVVTIAERIPGAAPPGIHDPRLFVDRHQLTAAFAAGGVELRLRGLRPAIGRLATWKLGWRARPPLVSSQLTTVLFQGFGRKNEES